MYSSVSVLQGAGTAIGELPPYFMARAARLSGNIDEEEQELEELMEEQRNAEHLVCATAVSLPLSLITVFSRIYPTGYTVFCLKNGRPAGYTKVWGCTNCFLHYS